MTGHWSELALCAEVGGDMFFPDKGESTRDAKDICGMCEVREQCLAFALAWPEELVGVWGGTSVTERRRMRRVEPARRWADVKPCGTAAAARRHHRRGEPLCAECRAYEAGRHRDQYTTAGRQEKRRREQDRKKAAA